MCVPWEEGTQSIHQIPGKHQLKVERLNLVHSLRVQVLRGADGMAAGMWGAWLRFLIVRKQREMHAKPSFPSNSA